jgi:type IV pilus assembly protein PilB
MPVKKQKKIGEYLLASKIVQAPQLEEALALQAKTNELLGKILQKLGFASEEEVAKALSKQLSIPFVTAAEMESSWDSMKLVPWAMAQKRVIFPMSQTNGVLCLAMANPFDWRTVDEVAFMTSLKVSPVLATESSILNALEKKPGTSAILADVIKDITINPEAPDFQLRLNGSRPDLLLLNIEADHNLENTPIIVKLVTSIMVDAAKSRASDIHIEPSETEVSVRYRIDGVLKTMLRYPLNIHDSVVSRIKIVSGLDITNKRLPQDGRTTLRLEDREINIRLSTLPSVNGEKVVLRLLDDSVALMSLPKLGLPDLIFRTLSGILAQPQGMVLVTGPTGSGKTTTLYALLQQFQSETQNIITVEDPVEYRVPGTTQIGINALVGLTFPSVLRHILRQDPDTILIGEIRDTETAEIAVQAAMTGHFVLSTLHTNNTVASITRLIDLGLSPNLVASSVTAILAQRLVRLICPKCKTPVDPPDAVREWTVPEVKAFYKGTGCRECKFTGYRGRIGVYELLHITRNFKQLIFQKASEEDLLKAARQNGMICLFDDAWAKVEQGLTTVDEIISKVPFRIPEG